MLLTALVQTKGGTLVVELPRDRIDLEIKIRSIGIQKTSDQIHIVDNEDCDVSVKLDVIPARIVAVSVARPRYDY